MIKNEAIESYIISHFLLIIYSLIVLTGSTLLVHHTYENLSDSKSCKPEQTHINGTSTSILLKLICIILRFKPLEHSSISESKLANSHIVFTFKKEKGKRYHLLEEFCTYYFYLDYDKPKHRQPTMTVSIIANWFNSCFRDKWLFNMVLK